MDDSTLLVVAGVLFLLFFVFVIIGAVTLFHRAVKQGFTGIILFVFGWIFIAPIMCIWSFFVGLAKLA